MPPMTNPAHATRTSTGWGVFFDHITTGYQSPHGIVLIAFHATIASTFRLLERPPP
jgi:hypothetical protein